MQYKDGGWHIVFSYRVLIIDDNAGIRMLLREILGAYGFTISEAANGIVGCQVAAEFKPDIILIDYKMPQLNGPSTLKRMSNSGIKVPAIMITAFSEGLSAEDINCPNLYTCITKPFNITNLLTTIKDCLESKNSLARA